MKKSTLAVAALLSTLSIATIVPAAYADDAAPTAATSGCAAAMPTCCGAAATKCCGAAAPKCCGAAAPATDSDS